MRGSLRFVVTALVLTAAVALPESAIAAKKAAKKPVGVLYTETNSPKRNQVQIFHRFADGSVQFLSENMNLRTLGMLATCAGGEVIPEF